ncbi:hypothetical protein [Actinoplanes subtropicus]|uniref:hypothetical protein n=1 Tax=Actinoplanes subtropicus TaxID=543632 RepID=UPI0004C3AB8C|nr:hypothetical protein [Actinoplanes subtropicus]
MTGFHDWQEVRAELRDGDEDAVAAERARAEARIEEFRRGGEGDEALGRAEARSSGKMGNYG